MELLAWRFLTNDQIENLYGEFEVVKTNGLCAYRALNAIDHVCAEEVQIQRGDKIYFYKGLNRLIFRTWGGQEEIISEQKEFRMGPMEDGVVGTIPLEEADLGLVLRRVAPCEENNRGEFSEVEETGIVSAVQQFINEEQT